MPVIKPQSKLLIDKGAQHASAIISNMQILTDLERGGLTSYKTEAIKGLVKQCISHVDSRCHACPGKKIENRETKWLDMDGTEIVIDIKCSTYICPYKAVNNNHGEFYQNVRSALDKPKNLNVDLW